ncbi:MAG: N-acetylmuramoyl-L-alanine amidase, partial [Bdellovibrionales bacterium]|nr:N-acetylmuramoyl-L-alanine amidase [Bdellovibrionales bacterium]
QKRWEKVAVDLRSYADRRSSESRAAEALVKSAILYESLFETTNEKTKLQAARQALEDLIKRYPKHPLVDDALIRLGDLFLNKMGDQSKAISIYQEVLYGYRDSDMFEAARLKLDSLKRKPRDFSRAFDAAELDPSRWRVILDPGHGGDDLGAVGVGGLLEKDVALDIAIRLGKLLDSEQVAVMLTRTRDEFVPLLSRTQLANDAKGDLFVSIHVNSSENGKLRGIETYYLDNADDAASKKLAERENESIAMSGMESDLQFMLSDLIQNAKIDESIRLANVVQRSLVKIDLGEGNSVVNLGVKRAPFFVLVGAHMPCILTELFFINNPTEGQLLAQDDVREALAEQLAGGIKAYLDSHERRPRP